MLVISMAAVMFLPRQFHVLVVQNPRERDVNSVSWSFPLYLFLINLFVLPIAFAGLLVFPEAGAEADGFILRLPLHFDSHLISVVVFLGGFSAATAMIVVDSLALSKMITNDVILPVLLRRRYTEDIYWITLFYTRLAMLGVLALGLLWARMEGGQLLLVEMGLLSFIAVAQCAPAIVLGLYWRRGSRKGAATGISAGFFIWFYTLILPALVREGMLPALALDRGAARDRLLRPTAFLGLAGLDTISHGVFWSLFVNIGLFVMVSLLSEQDADDRSQAAAFVGPPARRRSHRGRPPSSPHPRSSGSSTTTSGTMKPRRSCGSCSAARRPPTCRCRSCSRSGSASSGSSPPPRRGGGPDDRRGPVHDLEGGGPAARDLLPADAAVAEGDGGGGAPGRAAPRLGGAECRRLHLHRRHRRPTRHHEPGRAGGSPATER